MSAVIDQAIEILQRTNDGDDLSPTHLWLVQEAVNGGLNAKGLAEFEKLYNTCTSEAGYKKPWLHGIEHLTIDHEGFVRWKGKQVEHYESPWSHSEEAKEAAEELARRCRILEARGQEVNTTTAVWNWKDGD